MSTSSCKRDGADSQASSLAFAYMAHPGRHRSASSNVGAKLRHGDSTALAKNRLLLALSHSHKVIFRAELNPGIIGGQVILFHDPTVKKLRSDV